jgi:single-strand DNA-binding protein
MSNGFFATGNLGETPSLKRVSVDGQDRQVADLRIFADQYRRNNEGELEQAGGFWITGSVWDGKAQQCAALLRKGARIHVIGTLREDTWQDKETKEEQRAFRLLVDDVFLSLSRLESVAFKPKRDATQGEAVPA